MRFIVSISPDIVDIIQTQIDKGEYRTVQEFIMTSIQNQIYLIENPIDINESIEENFKTNIKSQASDTQPLDNLLDLKHNNVDTVEFTPNKHANTKYLSGFWNKFFPIKITARVLSNLMAKYDSKVPLNTLQEVASKEARRIGLSLVRSEKDSGRKRGDRLSTGLPVSKNSETSRSRFKSHFVGETKAGKIDGMPGTLELLDIKKDSNGTEYVYLTNVGLHFSNLENPHIDLGDKNSVLSAPEKEFLLGIIKNHLRKEFQDIKYILRLIDKGQTNTSVLLDSVREIKNDFSENQLTTYLSGQLNRLTDLGLVDRIYTGLSYSYKVTDKGINIIKDLLEE